MDQITIIDEARNWLIDCFSDQEDEIRETSDAIIKRNVERHYDGGWSEFLRSM